MNKISVSQLQRLHIKFDLMCPVALEQMLETMNLSQIGQNQTTTLTFGTNSCTHLVNYLYKHSVDRLQ